LKAEALKLAPLETGVDSLPMASNCNSGEAIWANQLWKQAEEWAAQQALEDIWDEGVPPGPTSSHLPARAAPTQSSAYHLAQNPLLLQGSWNQQPSSSPASNQHRGTRSVDCMDQLQRTRVRVAPTGPLPQCPPQQHHGFVQWPAVNPLIRLAGYMGPHTGPAGRVRLPPKVQVLPRT
jgi:hypothetical protein